MHIIFKILYTAMFLIASTAVSKNSVVTTAEIENIVFYPTNSIPSTVIALSDSDISSDINGKIQELHYKIGSQTKRGDTLAKIECSDYITTQKQAENSLAATTAKIELVQWQHERAMKLAKQQNLSEEEVQKLKSSLNGLKANINKNLAALTNAEIQVGRCSIKAPFSGVVTKKYASLGEYVRAGTPVYRLLNVHDLEIEAEIHQDEISSILNSNGVSFIINNARYPVQIRSILPQQNQNTKMQLVRLTFISNLPIAGASGRLEWSHPHPHIPVEYIQHINDDYGIFILRKESEGEFHAIFHKLPNALEGQSVVTNLPNKTHIIVKGREKLSDNQLIDTMKNE
ncbi:MAG: efflux RND transporter periplasmic adaptor subunit [Francisellaceae bacterium]|jgi:RND family efflux transporter MFP subunit|nr:efflux RND transporter periplasmic adaptor subunit [Francisellaceae bacterium]MBT6539690.1 efflux RND transporter periplasmic adaptor subunit [Francisellaceae bacterium]